METSKYINKTVFYLKEHEDGFCYLGSLDVFAVSETHLFNSDFTKCVHVEAIFESYKDAQEYMEKLGIEFYFDDKKIGFKKIYNAESDVRLS